MTTELPIEIENFHILIVEDDDQDYYLEARNLRECGLDPRHIVRVKSAIAAKEKLNLKKFDVILLDLQLGCRILPI